MAVAVSMMNVLEELFKTSNILILDGRAEFKRSRLVRLTIFRPYLNMEGKSSTQRESFFTFTSQLKMSECAELEKFYHQVIANLP